MVTCDLRCLCPGLFGFCFLILLFSFDFVVLICAWFYCCVVLICLLGFLGSGYLVVLCLHCLSVVACVFVV